MSSRKNPLLRYLIIDECLSNKRKRYWSLIELLAFLKVRGHVIKARTLHDDFYKMKHDEKLGYGAEIKFCWSNMGYYYEDPNYSIAKNQVSKKEGRSLDFASAVMRQYHDFEIVKQLEATVDSLTKSTRHAWPIPLTFVGVERALNSISIPHFDKVYNAACDKQPLRIVYEKFSEEKSEQTIHVFHPYDVRTYNNLWYLVGYSEKREGLTTLGIDRIKSLSHAPVSYKENTYDIDKHFYYTIGITVTEGVPQDIELHFNRRLANYVKLKKLHHTQHIIKEDENGLRVGLQLRPNPELMTILLGYGASIEVLKPAILRKRVADELIKATARYTYQDRDLRGHDPEKFNKPDCNY